ncbi:hypothetical protein [Alishewanella longhuensis]
MLPTRRYSYTDWLSAAPVHLQEAQLQLLDAASTALMYQCVT